MMAVTERADHRLLMDRTPVTYSHVSAATDLACLVRCAADARRLLRAGYAALRGTVVPASVSDRDTEDLFAKLGEWDSSLAICEALVLVDRLRARMVDYIKGGGLRRGGELGAMTSESQRLASAAVCVAALMYALRWRGAALAAGPETPPAESSIRVHGDRVDPCESAESATQVGH